MAFVWFLLYDSEIRVLIFQLLTGPEVWRQGWRQLFLVRVQASVTSSLELFIYYFFYQIVANGLVHLNGTGVMMWECTLDISGWMPQPDF